MVETGAVKEHLQGERGYLWDRENNEGWENERSGAKFGFRIEKKMNVFLVVGFGGRNLRAAGVVVVAAISPTNRDRR